MWVMIPTIPVSSLPMWIPSVHDVMYFSSRRARHGTKATARPDASSAGGSSCSEVVVVVVVVLARLLTHLSTDVAGRAHTAAQFHLAVTAIPPTELDFCAGRWQSQRQLLRSLAAAEPGTRDTPSLYHRPKSSKLR